MAMEETLVRRRAGCLSRTSSTEDEIMAETENNDAAEKSLYSDQNEGDAFGQSSHEDLATALKNVSTQDKEKLEEHSKSDSQEETGVEVIELRFERDAHKLHTHFMHCPNCFSPIRKVILGKRERGKHEVSTPARTQHLFGCSSCLTIFTLHGNKLRPFQLFVTESEDETTEAPEQPYDASEDFLQGNSQEDDITRPSGSRKGKVKRISFGIDDEETETDEEVTELESFERAVHKLHTHDVYCPNCNSQISKVVLRRREVKKQVSTPSSSRHPEGRGFNFFDIFGMRRGSSEVAPEDDNKATKQGISQGENSTRARGFIKQQLERDEKVIELEFFEREINKLHTHDMYCPNCNSQITKVILRTRRVKKLVSNPSRTRGDVFGFLSFFSIFIPKGNKLRPFQLWTEGEVESTEAPSGNVQNNQGGGFNYFGYFGESSKPPQVTTGNDAFTSRVPPEGENNATRPEDAPLLKPGNNLQPHPLPQYPGHGEIIVNIPEKTGNDVPVVPAGERLVAPQSPELTNAEKPEIIKSIVYGGLTESITSLSVITSAAASNATTWNIVALGFAILIAGLFILVQNLWDLKNDYQHENRYQELLGRRRHFLLHATIVILSYLVFGLVPPVTYGFTFCETDDTDMKLLAMAAASLICILILAIGKVYIQAPPHKYLKTVLYYLTTAIMASGVGFSVGDLVKKFNVEKLGWFQPNQAGILVFPGNQSLRPSLASS